MGWQAATIQILKLKTQGSENNSAVQSNKVLTTTSFTATTKAFPVNGATFVFVHAHDTTENLKGWHIIPCEEVKVTNVAGDDNAVQEVTFKASLQERRSGSYHLVGWAPMRQGTGAVWVNQVTTLERAFTLHQAPEGELQAGLKDSPYTEEPA